MLEKGAYKSAIVPGLEYELFELDYKYKEYLEDFGFFHARAIASLYVTEEAKVRNRYKNLIKTKA